MTHYLNGFAPDIECPRCNGHGEVCGVNPNRRSRFVGHDDLSPDDFTVECSECCGTGWRPMTPDEESDAAEAAYERQMEDYYGGGSPVTLDEQHHAAWKQKQELRK